MGNEMCGPQFCGMGCFRCRPAHCLLARVESKQNDCMRDGRSACIIASLFLRMRRGAKAKRIRGARSTRPEVPASPGYAHCADDCCITIAVQCRSARCSEMSDLTSENLFRMTEAYGLAPVKPQHSNNVGRQEQNKTSRPPVQLLASPHVILECDYALNLV